MTSGAATSADGVSDASHVSAVIVASSPERLRDTTSTALRREVGANGFGVAHRIATTTPDHPPEDSLDDWVDKADVFVDAVFALDAPALLASRASVTARNPAAVFILVADQVDGRTERAVRQADLVVVSDRTKPAVARMPLRAPMMDIPGSGDGEKPSGSWLAVLSRAVAIRTRAVGEVTDHLRSMAQQEGQI